MTDKPNVIAALSAVMAELGPIGKDQSASAQQGGYAYRGIEQITTKAQPLFAKHGIVFVPRVVGWEIRDLTVNSKPWTDTVEQVEYDVYGPGGIEDKVTIGPILAIGRDNSDKGANKALTQAYKYALLQTLCISDAKDDGDQASHEADAQTTEPPLSAALVERADLLPDDLKAKLLERLAPMAGKTSVTIDELALWPQSFTDAVERTVAAAEKKAIEQQEAAA